MPEPKLNTASLLDGDAIEELLLIFPEANDRLKMMETSITDMRASVEGLRSATDSGIAREVPSGWLHKLKGSAGNLGMCALEEAVAVIYHRVRNGLELPSETEIAHIENLVNRSIQAACEVGLFPTTTEQP